MARGTFVVFTNPVSTEREAEFNDWYNSVHAGEILSLPGFVAISRLKAGPTVKGAASHRYLALYECDDIEKARASLTAHMEQLNVSDALEDSATAVFFEEFFSLPAADVVEAVFE